MNTKIFKSTIILIAILIQFSFAQQLVEAIAAVVGQEIVLKSEVDQFVQNYAIQKKLNIRSNPELLKKLQSDVLNQLIEQKILLTKAEQDTIEVDDREVDKYVEEHVRYLIDQVGSEEQLEEIFQNPINKIKRDLRRETADRLKIEKLRRTKFQNIKISRREIEQFFNTYQDSIPEMKETVDISHIMKQIKVGDEGRLNTFQRISTIKEQIDNGADFEELAKEYSEDPGTASRGGDLGFQKRGDFLQEYEETAFGLENGQISDIVQTQVGFHIIQLIERRGEKIHTRHILIRLQPTSADEERIKKELMTIREQLLNGSNFDSLALLHSDDENVQNDKGHLGVWEVEKLAIPVFKNVLTDLEVSDISEPFKTEFGYHILKLNSREDARNLTLENDWEQIRQLALNFKMEKEYTKWISSIKKEVPIEVKISYN
jgi:peptidyl-prolyl cis-trans isomerase SurA